MFYEVDLDTLTIMSMICMSIRVVKGQSSITSSWNWVATDLKPEGSEGYGMVAVTVSS